MGYVEFLFEFKSFIVCFPKNCKTFSTKDYKKYFSFYNQKNLLELNFIMDGNEIFKKAGENSKPTKKLPESINKVIFHSFNYSF